MTKQNVLDKDTKAIIAQADEFTKSLQQGTPLIIKLPSQHKNYSELLLKIKERINTLTAARLKITRPLDESKKYIMDLFRPRLEALQNGENLIKRSLISYEEGLERECQKQQAKLREEARKKEEKEKEKLNNKANKEEAKGNTEVAETLRQQAEETRIPAPIIEAGPRVKGIHKSQNWKFKVVDLARVPRQYLIIDTVTLNNIAKITKGTRPIPGIEFYPETIMSVQASRE